MKWQERPHNPRDAVAIAQRLGLPELMGRILASRNIALECAEAFLQPTLREFLPDPFHLKDMEKAARRVAEEIEYLIDARTRGGISTTTSRREGASEESETSPSFKNTIAIFGDYDVDGATSSALLVRYLRAFGIEPLVHIPDRIKEGYGPNAPAMLSLQERGARIIITVDCGTSAFEPLAEAKKAGLDVVVIDHHKGDAQLPACYALVNPNRYDETSPHTQLAACGVTFLLLVAINKVLKENAVDPLPDLLQLLDITALGTVCDVVPLTGVNRALVVQGLKIMAKRQNPGITAAMDVARLSEAPSTYHAGYIIGPRINAGGRVGEPDLGARLLSTDDALEARGIAERLDVFNSERKAIESMVQEEAMADARAFPDTDAVIIVGRTGWHPGVIGIVAGRLKEHFNKPVAVLAIENGIGKASARSITGVDLGTAVIAARHSDLLLAGGGHAMAAGFSITEENIPRLREFLNNMLAEKVKILAQEKVLHIDGAISTQGVTADLVRLIERAGPFGAGNSSVRLVLSNIKVVNAGVVGAGHVRAVIVDAGIGGKTSGLKAMAFRSEHTPLGQMLLNSRGRSLHVAGQAKINTWQGRESVDFLIDDIAY